MAMCTNTRVAFQGAATWRLVGDGLIWFVGLRFQLSKKN